MRRFTWMLVAALVVPASAALAGEQGGLGRYKATLTPDNRVKYTLEASEFTFTRLTATNSTETEITIAGSNEAPVVIRFGGGGDISVERGGQVASIRHGDGGGGVDSVAGLLNGRAVGAFRRLVGSYERELMNDPATLDTKTSPFAYALVLTAAFVSQLAGDPNAVERTRDLIRRRIAAKLRAAAWRMVDCVSEYEQSLMSNDSRNTTCNDAADNMDSFWGRAGARLLCAAEFLGGALSSETQFAACSGLAPLKIQ